MSFGVELLQGSHRNTLFFMCEIQGLEVMLGSAMCHRHAPPGNVVLFMLVIQGLEVMLGSAMCHSHAPPSVIVFMRVYLSIYVYTLFAFRLPAACTLCIAQPLLPRMGKL